ncbi:MAG: GIY-YIG nuclease family protein [Alphaproteobacteria bacterium]
MWYVYFLRPRSDDIYVGSTNDLRRRVESHRQGRVISTKAHSPVVLKSYVSVLTEKNARTLERYFKTGSGEAFASKRFW